MKRVEFAEDCNYWKSSTSSPESWIQKSIGLIESIGGTIYQSGFAREHGTGRAAYLLQFEMGYFCFINPLGHIINRLGKSGHRATINMVASETCKNGYSFLG